MIIKDRLHIVVVVLGVAEVELTELKRRLRYADLGLFGGRSHYLERFNIIDRYSFIIHYHYSKLSSAARPP